MSFEISFLAPAAEAYARGLAPPPTPLLARVEDETRREGQPAVGRAVGALLRALVAASGGRRVLEVGTNVGYSALWMAQGLAPDGRLETIELDPGLARRARANLAEAGLGARAVVHEGAALDVLPRLGGPFDLVFLDCVKAEYPAYLDHALRLLRPGGIVAADNLFWRGEAWDASVRDPDVEGLREYARRASTDPQLASVLVPMEDGVMVSVVLPG